ncbi:MAG: prepilin-type N-terminal cleavage/methylation domain-containing protein [Gemmatimonadota bacterium]|nr:MAG: prepilin-type N-terminal cleavage/methylation domain-containing protein [Gemmatimonadota bacterium]
MKPARLRDREGVTLVEILIGVIILSVALLGLAAAGGVAARQVYMGRVDMGRWAALQQQLESLVAQGYDNVTAGSDTVQSYPMKWTVAGTDPKQITLVMERENFRGETVQDTLVTYMADPN